MTTQGVPQDRPLRILLTGNSNQWELGHSFRKAFAALGHEAELFDWYGRIARRTTIAPERVSRALLTAAARRLVAVELIAAVRRSQPDVVVLLKTDDVPHGTIRLLRAAAPQCRVVTFHPDDPFNIDRLRGPSHPRALYVMDAVDHYFIWSDRLLARIRARTAGSVSYLGFASDPEFTRPLPVTTDDQSRFGTDVSFVGNWDPKREAWLAPIAHHTGISLSIWGGPAWSTRAQDPRVRASWRGDFAVGDDFVKAVRCSRVSVNVLRTQNESAENMRTYEIPASGGLMLAEWSEQQARVFRPDAEAAYGKTPEHLLSELRRLLAMPAEALASKRAAALACASLHTYKHRAASALAALRMPSHAA